ncbi:MAG: hypothetical protein IJ761_02945 [Bacteroidales bacterium]|nr:hypothetical protein [Bacteroidales bacterium]
MSHKTALRIYEIASYVLIIAATVVYFAMRQQRLTLTLLILVLAIAMRMMMERHRYKACEEENDQLRDDLRRLTRLLAEEKKNKSNQ